MELSLRWLKQFLPEAMDARAIIDTLTAAGIEVESVLDLGMVSGKIVVAKVLEVQDHPNADKLHVCKVDIGEAEPATIVCGAPNVAAGVAYPCALPGATMPDGMEIKKAKIRGQASEGMLCSARELGLGADHAGIMAIPDTYKIGEPYDAILELKVTPNRPDWLSVFGVAREIAAMTGKQVFSAKPRFKETLERIEGFLHLAVAARSECPRYVCRMVRGVKTGESPLWLRRALEASGLRPINNVVDATNYVLMEFGHPLHAFDYTKLRGGQINVRMAKAGEKLTLIDGRELELSDEDLVIADAERPAALAGIMGGRDSEVTVGTVDVLLEAAWFEPRMIRKTARRHGLSTDASYRFERGADRERLTLAINRTAQLIQEVAGGEIIKGMLDIQTTLAEPTPIALEVGRVNGVLGVKLSSTEIADFLVYLGFEIRRADGEKLVVAVPSHRVDIARDVDLIEEVARLYGYNKIPSTVPRMRAMPSEPSVRQRTADRALDALAALGFCEAMTYSFIGEREAAALGFDPALQPHIANPFNPDQAIMRPSLLPGLLAAAARNRKQNETRIALCEIGKVWLPGARAAQEDGERVEAGLILGGASPAHWSGESREADFYDLKGLVESLLAAFGLDRIECAPLTDSPAYHPGRAAKISVNGQMIGEIGETHPDLDEAFDLKGRFQIARIDLDALAGLWKQDAAALKPVPRFPGSWRDLAVVVAKDRPSGEVLEAASKAGGAMLEDLALTDVYEGSHVAEGQKSLTLRLWIRSPEKTLAEDEIQGIVDGVMARLVKEFGATIRA